MASYQSFTKIAIIESLKTSEHHTGRELADALTPIAAASAPNVTIEYIEAPTARYVMRTLQTLADDAERNGALPILHFECHGNQDGIACADGVGFYWEQLSPVFTRINVQLHAELLIVMGSCFGGLVAQTVKPKRRAPYWAIIGPLTPIYPKEGLKRFTRFYTTLLETKDGDRALSALMGIPGTQASVFFTTAQAMFKKSYANYLAQTSSPEAQKKRAAGLLEDARTQNPAATMSEKDVIRLIETTERPFFEEWRRTFFMLDLDPEKTLDDTLTYESISRAAANVGKT